MEPSTAIVWAALVCFLIAFVFLVFVFYRQKREADFRQLQAELARQIAEVEMKVLRSQMNPHFIFNALNAVYRFMQTNDLQNATQYLLKVSALMRQVLENSLHESISLQEDLNALKLYIEIEQMRLQHSFQFEIVIANDVSSDNTFVPPLIIQPFIENAVWHGLKNREKEGLLSINISKKEDVLIFIIEDNGLIESDEQRKNNPVSGVKKKSLGLEITRERLEILNKTKNTNAFFKLEDKWDEQKKYSGKRVILHLPLEEL